jgi:hypothetical protein
MDRTTLEIANEISKILDELKSYEDMKNAGNHFQFRKHYGVDSEFVKIPREYNDRFIKFLDEIIAEYEQRLEDL